MDLQKMDLHNWQAPELSPDMPHGDMPGDKIKIDDSHIQKATTIFPLLIKELKKENKDKVVVSVFGGSGVGKSEIASLLTYYLQSVGIGAYVLSGDNYPRRIPLYNDAERFSIFRAAGLRGLLKDKLYSKDVQTVLDELWKSETDPDPKQVAAYPWLASYQKAGRSALKGYLGTEKEQDYDEINEIIDAFKKGEEKIYLKRMGRSEDERWYDAIDFSNISVLVIEWTHGGNKALNGIDIPILLNSTPEETREHRRLRARDGKTDSAFTTMVLEIEQEELDDRAPYAKIIIAKSGEVLDPQSFRKD
ncbi:MAG: hypothetical protein IIY76_01920 [Erysipelotrichaceae bacterium]|nr:hypothetical protein [Erysipelotrichaceae bacterium]